MWLGLYLCLCSGSRCFSEEKKDRYRSTIASAGGGGGGGADRRLPKTKNFTCDNHTRTPPDYYPSKYQSLQAVLETNKIERDVLSCDFTLTYPSKSLL